MSSSLLVRTEELITKINFQCFYFCLIGRHVQSGIDDITSDDRWALYLDKLNEAIWPGGKLREDSEKPKTEIEKARTRKEAAQALMDAFPGTLRFYNMLHNFHMFFQFAHGVREKFNDSLVLQTAIRKQLVVLNQKGLR